MWQFLKKQGKLRRLLKRSLPPAGIDFPISFISPHKEEKISSGSIARDKPLNSS
jgi:hypothetical protein